MIRSIRDEDISRVAEIITSLPLWQRYGITKESAHATVSGSARKTEDSEWLVAEENGVVQGFVWILHTGCFGMSGYIKMIGVSQQNQGRGLGGALLRAAEEAIFARGPNVFLLASHFNQRARSFYEAHGYMQVGVISSYVLDDVDEVLYRKTRGALRARQQEASSSLN